MADVINFSNFKTEQIPESFLLLKENPEALYVLDNIVKKWRLRALFQTFDAFVIIAMDNLKLLSIDQRVRARIFEVFGYDFFTIKNVLITYEELSTEVNSDIFSKEFTDTLNVLLLKIVTFLKQETKLKENLSTLTDLASSVNEWIQLIRFTLAAIDSHINHIKQPLIDKYNIDANHYNEKIVLSPVYLYDQKLNRPYSLPSINNELADKYELNGQVFKNLFN